MAQPQAGAQEDSSPRTVRGHAVRLLRRSELAAAVRLLPTVASCIVYGGAKDLAHAAKAERPRRATSPGEATVLADGPGPPRPVKRP